MNNLLSILVILLASVNLVMTRFAMVRLRQPTTPAVWLVKVFISALSPVLFLIGIVATLLGIVLDSLPAIAIGSCSALLYLIHIIKIGSAPDPSTGLEKTFGEKWDNRFHQERKKFFLRSRYVLRLSASPDPIFNQNISFHTIADTNRELLCDIWQPPSNISHSGLAFIYLHGSAW